MALFRSHRSLSERKINIFYFDADGKVMLNTVIIVTFQKNTPNFKIYVDSEGKT